MPSFNFYGVNIYYEETGEGEPLLCLHGLGASSYTWQDILPGLAKTHRVITLDMKGFGDSDKPKERSYSARDQAGIIVAFIDAMQLRRLTLVGSSFGGTVALLTYLELQTRRSHPVIRLILLAAAAYPQHLPIGFRLLHTPLLNRLLMTLLTVPAIKRLVTKISLHQCLRRREVITPEKVDAYLRPQLLPGAPQAFFQSVLQLLPPDVDAITQRYPSINAPALLIWGAGDPLVPPSIGQRLHAALPNSRLEIIPGVGHAPQEECADITLGIIQKFLASNR